MKIECRVEVINARLDVEQDVGVRIDSKLKMIQLQLFVPSTYSVPLTPYYMVIVATGVFTYQMGCIHSSRGDHVVDIEFLFSLVKIKVP